MQRNTPILFRQRTPTRAVAAILTVAFTVTHATGCVAFRSIAGADGPAASQERRLIALTESSAAPVRVALYWSSPSPWRKELQRRSHIAASVRVALEGLGAQVSDHIEPPTPDVRSVLLVIEELIHPGPLFASMLPFALTLGLIPIFQASTYRVRAFELTPHDATMGTAVVAEAPFDAEGAELRRALGGRYNETMALLGNPAVIRSATAERRLSGSASLLLPTPWMSSTGEKAGPTDGPLFEEYAPRVVVALAIEAVTAVLQQ